MTIRVSRRAMMIGAFASVTLLASSARAVFYPLGKSSNDWGIQYDVQLFAAGPEHANVIFTLIDEGRLKSIHSFTLVALRQVSPGTYAYDAKEVIPLTTTADGKRIGQVKIRREHLDHAMIRVLTFNVDGKRQTGGAALYNLPLRKQASPTPPATVAAPLARPATSVVK